MELLLFSGIQAAGKSTFFKDRCVDTHLRINLDMLRTRRREALLVAACLRAKQPFAVENTNLLAAERARYIVPARAARFRMVGYRFHVPLEEAIARNARRVARQPVPEKAIRAAFRIWELPGWDEGFAALFDVWSQDGTFVVREVSRA